MKTRVIKIGEKYYPQYKEFGMWEYWRYSDGKIISTTCFDSAIHYCKEKSGQKMEVIWSSDDEKV